MMIDTKKLAKLVCRNTEVMAEIKVCMAIGDFISSNMDRCKEERNFCELQVWIDALRDITNKLNILHEEYSKITEELEKMS